ncbi:MULTISPECIES: DUF2635 domain-containing protein [Pectobacterium]|uniref:DUF2635 domain-containing protein n=1 Tax=Pectobacterium TaxID=122277 RepID=UPI001968F8F4|nr:MULTISPECIES: DUF2635 domain-containing protein [Pectobacterium]MBN3057987.1 DUF2635 domain-containing protein [Pectobacterium brasiliense]UUE37967.1 DUF2635 domain-containing protein [Pectobacterium aroidearum]UUE42342.1 DUF2635 domain-containing protein [Pectobacterium aroidearum]
MFVKPKDGRSVRCPVKGIPLPKDGAEVPNNPFWNRRVSDGDVERVENITGTDKKRANNGEQK